MAQRSYRNRGSLLWDFYVNFVASRALFLSIFKRYERRVLRAAKDRAVDRNELVLPPQELWTLFHSGRLEHLRDRRLEPMRDLAQRIFGEQGDEGLLDAYCGHIYHEVSILTEEHESVGRFVRHHDPRRYRDLFREVSGYYPTRLRRVRRFFTYAMKRVTELLPKWSDERVVVRSAYLFGERYSRRAYGRGKVALYQRMYPTGGEIRGFYVAAQSFYDSGFLEEASEALSEADRMAQRLASERELMSDERQAVEAIRALEASLHGADSAPVASGG